MDGGAASAEQAVMTAAGAACGGCRDSTLLEPNPYLKPLPLHVPLMLPPPSVWPTDPSKARMPPGGCYQLAAKMAAAGAT